MVRFAEVLVASLLAVGLVVVLNVILLIFSVIDVVGRQQNVSLIDSGLFQLAYISSLILLPILIVMVVLFIVLGYIPGILSGEEA